MTSEIPASALVPHNHGERLEAMGECEWLSSRDLETVRNHRRHALTSFAAAMTPFYRGRGIVAAPILDRATTLANEVALHSLKVPSANGEVLYVHGRVEGRPTLAVAWTRAMARMQDDLLCRICRWHGVDPATPMVEVDPEKVFGFAEDEDQWSEVLGAIGIASRRRVLPAGAAAGDVLASVAELGASVLKLPAFMLGGVLHAAESAPLADSLKHIIAQGDAFAADLDVAVASSGNTGLIRAFMCAEAGLIGADCPHSDGLHLFTDVCDVEILRPDGSACDTGEEGDVVVTPFFNFAMPLLRYRTAARASWQPSCVCGRTLPLVSLSLFRPRPTSAASSTLNGSN